MLLQDIADFHQHVVAGLVAAHIVDGFEVVEIDIEQHRISAVALKPRQKAPRLSKPVNASVREICSTCS